MNDLLLTNTKGVVYSPSMDQLPRRRQQSSTYLVVAGGGLLSLSVFLPWIHVILLGDLSLMQIADLNHRHGLALLMVIAGGISAFIAFIYPERVHLRFWVAIIAAIIGIFVGFEMIHSLNADGYLVKIQNGSYLAILAGLLLLAGVIPDLRR